MEGTHPLFTRLVSRGVFLLVYGPAATGKTHLAYHAYKLARARGLEPVFIATEPGTVTFLEAMGEDFIVARTQDEAARLVAEHSLAGHYVVLDSANWHYRENPGLGQARLLSFISAILSQAGGFATAQVSLEEDRPSGEAYIVHWAHALGATSRGPGGVFTLTLTRPVERVLAFRIGSGGVEWL